MRYNYEVDGIELKRDCYAHHFAEPGDIEFNYSVYCYGSCIEEDENPKELGKRLEAKGNRILKIAKFLKGKKSDS